MVRCSVGGREASNSASRSGEEIDKPASDEMQDYLQSTNPLALATLLAGYANFHMLLTSNVDLSLQRKIYIKPNSHQFKFESQ